MLLNQAILNLVSDALEQLNTIGANSKDADSVIKIKNEILTKLLDCPYWLSKSLLTQYHFCR